MPRYGWRWRFIWLRNWRIDTFGNYEPTNCRWVTPKEQMRNKTNTVYLVVNGKRISGTQFAEIHGLVKENIYSYIKVRNILERINE